MGIREYEEQVLSMVPDSLSKPKGDSAYERDQETIKMLRKALEAVYSDIELPNVPGGSEELNVLVSAALAQREVEIEEEGKA